jgi:hypothetical protein
MADTIITNTPERGVSSDNGALGVVLALIVLAVVVIGGIYLYRHGSVGVPNTGTNINVTVPSTDSGPGSGGAASDGSTGSGTQ